MEFRRRKPLDFRVEISPLIDVVFLLLIFFMVSSTFLEEAALEIDLPESGSTAETPQEALTILVRRDGTVVLGERELPVSALEETVRAEVGEERDRPVVIKGDENVAHGTMVKVYDAVRAAGARGFHLDAKPPAGSGAAETSSPGG